MRKQIVCTTLWMLLAAGVASGATIFVERTAVRDAFCEGYAICK